MTKYELLYVLDRDLSEEKRESLIEKNKAYVVSKGGNVLGLEKWGIKKFAYPINFKNEGFYVLTNIEIDGKEVSDMGKLMNITDGIVRHMFVKK